MQFNSCSSKQFWSFYVNFRFFCRDTWETFVLLSDHYHLRVMMKDININLLTELFSGNFNGNFIELKCTTLFFEGKTKQKKTQKSCLSVSCCLFWWKWLSLSRILTWKKIQIPLCQEMALSDWNYKLIKKPEKSDGFQIVYWKWY